MEAELVSLQRGRHRREGGPLHLDWLGLWQDEGHGIYRCLQHQEQRRCLGEVCEEVELEPARERQVSIQGYLKGEEANSRKRYLPVKRHEPPATGAGEVGGL